MAGFQCAQLRSTSLDYFLLPVRLCRNLNTHTHTHTLRTKRARRSSMSCGLEYLLNDHSVTVSSVLGFVCEEGPLGSKPASPNLAGQSIHLTERSKQESRASELLQSQVLLESPSKPRARKGGGREMWAVEGRSGVWLIWEARRGPCTCHPGLEDPRTMTTPPGSFWSHRSEAD